MRKGISKKRVISIICVAVVLVMILLELLAPVTAHADIRYYYDKNGNLYKIEDDYVYVKDVWVNTSYVELTQGDTYQLDASVEPSNATNKKVHYESDSPYVALVDSGGMIHANNAGYTTIFVWSDEGEYETQVGVNVKANNAQASKVVIDPTMIIVREGLTTRVKAKVQPGNISDKSVTWSVDDPTVAYINEYGVVLGVTPGITNVTAWSNNNGMNAKATIHVFEASKDPNYLYAAVQKILTAPPGGIVSLVSAIPMTFDLNVENALKMRPDVQTLLSFTYNEKVCGVAIPPNFDLTPYIGDDGYVDWRDLADSEDERIIVKYR